MKKLLFFLYTFLLLSFTLFSYTFIDPNLSYLQDLYSGFVFTHRGKTTLLYLSFIFLLFIFYFLFMLLLKIRVLNNKDLKWLIIITVGILIFSYPAMLSYDIFNYIATAKVLFFYRENPYIVMPIEFIQDPLLSFTHAANKIALYGPVWLLLGSIPHILGFGDFVLTLFSFKLFVGLFYVGLILVIWKISHNLFALALFALNPLIVIETLVSSHNDLVMMFLATLSLYMLIKKRIAVAIVFFLGSILIKYATVFLAPVFIYVIIKHIKKEKINQQQIFLFSALSMCVIFILSPLREEMYPWYLIWILTFVVLVPKYKLLLYIALGLSFSLLLRYIPFMYLGTHFGPTPMLKILLTVVPALVVFGFLFLKDKKLLKR